MAQPWNLIVITSDEMRGDCPSFMGNPDCRTPHLDRFADKGVVFSNHFTVHGKCVPSRIAMMTGRYSHTDGIRTVNETNLLKPGDPSLLSALKRHRYETAYFGHNHVWEELFASNDKGGGCTDYHSFTTGWFAELLQKQHPVPATGPVEPMDLDHGGFHYRGRKTEPLSYFCDDNRAEQAVHYLKNIRDRSRPFYMQVNFGAPHPAYATEEPYFSMYDRQGIRPWPYDLPANAPLPLRKMREIRTGLDAPEAAFRELQAVYYGMVTKVDLLIGRVLDAIESEGLWDNTIVMFWVDHGDFAGQHGLPEKWDTAMNDCILHVPQILYAPGLPTGHRVTSLTEHTDLLPTVLELLGIEPDWGVHGQSLLPIIAGQQRKQAVFADGGHEQEMWGRFNFGRKPTNPDGTPRTLDGKQRTYAECPETMARAKMVRTDKWKLVIRLTGGNELYDMENDPDEMTNLWGQADLAPVVMELQQSLIEWCLRTDTDRPRQERVGA